MEKEPKIQGLTDIQEIRELLVNWVDQFDQPETEDLNTFCDYLIELIKVSDLEKVKLLVLYLDYLVSNKVSWRSSISYLKENITETMITLYGYPLKF